MPCFLAGVQAEGRRNGWSPVVSCTGLEAGKSGGLGRMLCVVPRLWYTLGLLAQRWQADMGSARAGLEGEGRAQVKPGLIQSECWDNGVAGREKAFFRDSGVAL